MATELLQVILKMAAEQYKREARDAATATGKISTEAKSVATQTGTLQSRMVGFGSVLRGAVVAGGITAVVGGLRSAVSAAEEAASAVANTEQIIRTTGGVANVTAADIDKMTGRLMALTGVEDEVIREGANVLLTFRNLRNEAGEGNNVYDRTVGLMLDVGAVMGTDASSAALQLGKALNDPVSQMGALSRAGLTFTQQQKDQIKELVANNDLLSAQKLILDELETQLGGTAEASAKATDKIGAAFGEIIEAGGTALLPILDDVATELQHIVGLTDELDRVAKHADGAADSAEAFLTVVAEETGGAGFVSGLGTAVEEFVLRLIPGIDRMQRFRRTLEDLVPRLTVEELHRARDGLGLLGEQLGLTQSEIDLVADVLDSALAEAATTATVKVDAADQAMRNMAARGGKEAQNILREIGGEAETATPSLQDMADAILAVNDAALEAASPIFAAQQALERYEEVLERVGEDGEVTAEEQLELAEAALEANSKLAAVGAGDTTAGLQAIADALGISHGAARDLVEELGILDGTEVNLLFTASMPAADRALLNHVSSVTNKPTSKASNVTANFGGVRAHGGPVHPGSAFLVGERGPELFVPQTAGAIVPNSALSAGPTFVFNGDVYGDDAFVRRVRDANAQMARLGMS